MKLHHLSAPVGVVALLLSCAQWPGDLPGALDRSDYVTPGAALLDVAPQVLTPSCIPGGSPANAGDKWFAITNKGQGTLSYTVRVELSGATMWLLCSPASGSCTTETDTLRLSYATTGLSVGTYHAQVLVMSAGLDTDTVHVDLSIVDTSSPQVGLDQTILSLSCQQSAGQIDTAIRVWNAGAGVLHFSAAADSPWVQCVVAADSSKDTADVRRVSVKVLPGALAVGSHQAHITISPVGLAPQTVTVQLTVTPPPGPSFSVSPDTLRPVCAAGRTASSQTIRIWSTGSPLTVSIAANDTAWVQVSPAYLTSTGPTDTQTATVTYRGSGVFSAGSQKMAQITIAATDSHTVGVLLNVVSGAIAASRYSLHLECSPGDSTSDTLSIWSLDSMGRTVSVRSAGGAAWLWFNNPTERCSIFPRRVVARCAATGLAAGTYRDTILLADTSGRGDTLRIPVEFVVLGGTVLPLQGGQRFAFTFGYNDFDSIGSDSGWLRWRVDDPSQNGATPNKYWGEIVLDTSFAGGDRTPLGKNTIDSALVAYRLTPAQEAGFSRTDGVPSAFWAAVNWGGRDYALLDAAKNACPGHDQFGGSHPSIEAKAAGGDSGIYLEFTVTDSSWTDRTTSTDRNRDAVVFWADPLSKAGQAACISGCLVDAANYSLTTTSFGVCTWMGDTLGPPPDFLYDHYHSATFAWSYDRYTYNAAPAAIGAAVEVSYIDQHHKVLECLLPWRMFGITP